MNFKRIFFLLFLTYLSFLSFAAEKLYTITQYIHDETNTLSKNELESLRYKLSQYADTAGSQIVVLIISSTNDLTIEDYSYKVAESNQIGRKKLNDGILIVIAKDDRKVRIEVGYGLEGAIPDVYAKRIIDNVIVKEFREGNFYNGIYRSVEIIIGLINGEELPGINAENIKSPKNKKNNIVLLMAILFPIFLGIGSYITLKLGNTKGAIIVGIVLFAIIFILTLSVTFSFVYSLIISLISMNKKGGGRSGGGGWFYPTGGGGFGGSSGGFSSGGFSGGGGSFGGGGASGGW